MRLRSPVCLLGAGLLAACVGSSTPEGQSSSAIPVPAALSGAFDGSQSFRMWIDTMRFARQIEEETGKRLRFTYFINGCYYDRTIEQPGLGKPESREEQIVRWALTQQAVVEGHEIANHSLNHYDGSRWTRAEWDADFDAFHRLVENNLFEPVLVAGRPAFPDWQPLASAAPGATGSACQVDADCQSAMCLPVSPARSFCSQMCGSSFDQCPAGTACGNPLADEFNVCVPLPSFPVVVRGHVLFDADGNPNLDEPLLRPYRVVGFRAPVLGYDAELFEVLAERGYEYDTSMILPLLPPRPVRWLGRSYPLWEFPLMRGVGLYPAGHPDHRTTIPVPMDWGYWVAGRSPRRMVDDYERTIVAAYNRGTDWNIGHHFALWWYGEYWEAMKTAFSFAAQGCPGADGALSCADLRFATFRQLAEELGPPGADAQP